EAFDDKIPLSYWPLPKDDFLDSYPRPAQLQYWTAAATDFDQTGWLSRSPIALELPTPGRAGAAQSLEMSAAAAQILGAHPRGRRRARRPRLVVARVSATGRDDPMGLAAPARQLLQRSGRPE